MALKRRILVVVAALAVALVAAAPTALAKEAPSTGKQVHPMVGCSGQGCWPVYSYRDMDVDVTSIQYLLRYRGYANFAPNQGYFGPQTRQAVVAFQRSRGLGATGVVDGPTWRALVGTIRSGQRSDAVRALQVNLRVQYGFNLPVTGYYGSQTRAAVGHFQANANIVDAGAWRRIISYR